MGTEFKRVGLRMPEDVKEWYAEEGDKLGLNMSQYMTLILVQNKRSQESMKVMKEITEMNHDPKLIGMNEKMVEWISKGSLQEMIEMIKQEASLESSDD
jgi:hypothetical protein